MYLIISLFGIVLLVVSFLYFKFPSSKSLPLVMVICFLMLWVAVYNLTTYMRPKNELDVQIPKPERSSLEYVEPESSLVESKNSIEESRQSNKDRKSRFQDLEPVK